MRGRPDMARSSQAARIMPKYSPLSALSLASSFSLYKVPAP